MKNQRIMSELILVNKYNNNLSYSLKIILEFMIYTIPVSSIS